MARAHFFYLKNHFTLVYSGYTVLGHSWSSQGFRFAMSVNIMFSKPNNFSFGLALVYSNFAYFCFVLMAF